MTYPSIKSAVFYATIATLVVFSLLTQAQTTASTATTPPAAPDDLDLRYSFGPLPVTDFTQVTPDDNYTPERGYGFDLSSSPTVVNYSSRNPMKAGYTTGTDNQPFFFSVKLPPGIYDVKVTLGEERNETITTVKSETRRLMLENVHTDAAEITMREFLAHVRVPQIPGGGIVRMKPRENQLSQLFLYWEDKKPMTFMELDWDEKLTLEFSGAHVALCDLEITKPAKPLTVYLVGDSTMTDQMMEPWGAWGMQFPRWFKPPVVIANYAESGESAASFFGEQRWAKLMSEVHTGDYILIQFGINDRATPLDRFKQYIEQMVSEARAKGAIPVLVTSQNLRSGFWGPDGNGQQTLGNYPHAMWEVAVEQKTGYIDLNAMSIPLYEAIGQAKLPQAFVDTTHQNAYGSYELAKCVVQACIDAKLPFAKYVVDDWQPFDPKHPDSMENFNLPPDPQMDPTKLPGGSQLPKEKVPVAGKPGEFADPPTAAATAPMRATAPNGSSTSAQ